MSLFIQDIRNQRYHNRYATVRGKYYRRVKKPESLLALVITLACITAVSLFVTRTPAYAEDPVLQEVIGLRPGESHESRFTLDSVFSIIDLSPMKGYAVYTTDRGTLDITLRACAEMDIYSYMTYSLMVLSLGATSPFVFEQATTPYDVHAHIPIDAEFGLAGVIGAITKCTGDVTMPAAFTITFHLSPE